MTELELKKIFGKNINTRRERKGWNQDTLAEKANVSKNTISDIETGQKFARAKTMVSLAKALGTELYELFKPDNVLPDKTIDIIAKLSEEVREKVAEIGNSYIEGMKG